jgi:uncharacterized protein involved in cysteine biosynthesis
MTGQFLKAMAQLNDPKLRGVLWLSVFLSLLVFAALWFGLWLVVQNIAPDAIPGLTWLSEKLGEAFDWLAGSLFVIMLLVLTLMLFPAVITVIVGFFLERVVVAVEARHYPQLPEPRTASLSETVMSTVKFGLVVVLVNLLALPFYALLMFLPPMNVLLFYLVNGYLVSREYFELVALRRLDPPAASRLRRQHRGRLQFAGMLVVLLMTIPVVNLLTPVVAAAFMLHVFQTLPQRRQ